MSQRGGDTLLGCIMISGIALLFNGGWLFALFCWVIYFDDGSLLERIVVGSIVNIKSLLKKMGELRNLLLKKVGELRNRKGKKTYMWKSILVLSVVIVAFTIGCIMYSQNEQRQSSDLYVDEPISIPTKQEYVAPAPSTNTGNKYEYTGEYYDPYGVEDYDNGDDFADEWADEFADSYNGDYDDGYDDAYDYWEEEY